MSYEYHITNYLKKLVNSDFTSNWRLVTSRPVITNDYINN